PRSLSPLSLHDALPIWANTWSGPITLMDSPVFAIRGTLTLSGSISGSAGLTKSGLGVLALTGTNNSYTGVTRVTDGLLLVNSSLDRKSTRLNSSHGSIS